MDDKDLRILREILADARLFCGDGESEDRKPRKGGGGRGLFGHPPRGLKD